MIIPVFFFCPEYLKCLSSPWTISVGLCWESFDLMALLQVVKGLTISLRHNHIILLLVLDHYVLLQFFIYFWPLWDSFKLVLVLSDWSYPVYDSCRHVATNIIFYCNTTICTHLSFFHIHPTKKLPNNEEQRNIIKMKIGNRIIHICSNIARSVTM